MPLQPDQTPPTPEEIAQARENAYNANHYPSWTWSEEQVTWVPPTPPPTDGLPYIWDEPTLSWVNFPNFPTE